MRLHGVYAGHRVLDRPLDVAAMRCASSSGRSPGSFRWSETSVRPSTRSTATLWISRTLRDLHRGGVGEFPGHRILDRRLDVDDDVRLGQRALDRRLDGIGRGMPLPDRRRRRDRDDDVGEVPAGRRAHPQPPQPDRRLDPGDRLSGGLLGVRRRPVHQHVDVPAHQPHCRRQHQRGDEQCGDRVGLGHPARTPISPTSTASDPAKSLPKCTAFDSSAALWNRRPSAARSSVRETSISEHDADHQERPPGRVDARCGSSRRAARPRGRRRRR